MTLATLNYIHTLLEHEEETTRSAKKMAFQSWEQAEEERAGNTPALRDLVDKTRMAWNKANDALRDFEAQEW